MEKRYNFNDKTKLLTPFWLNIFLRSFQRNSFHTWMDYWAGLHYLAALNPPMHNIQEDLTWIQGWRT